MNKKDLLIPFNAPFNEQDTEVQIYGYRANNPDICGNNGLQNICAFTSDDSFVKKSSRAWKSNTTSSKIKPLNYCLAYGHNSCEWRELEIGIATQ